MVGERVDMKKAAYPIIMFVLLSAIGAAVHAAPMAKTIAVEGDVEVKGADGKWLPLKAGAPLSEKDVVRTLKNSRVQIQLDDSYILLFKEFSIVQLSAAAGKRKAPRAIVPVGEFLIGKLGKSGSDTSFSVRTPTVIAGVRGTLFWGLADADLSSTFACFEGQIALTSAGRTVLLNPGAVSKTEFGKAPAKPAKANVPLSYLDTFAINGSTAGLKEKLNEK